jgi:hypothetical protein
MRRGLLVALLVSFAISTHGQTIPDDTALSTQMDKWKAALAEVKPENLQISYQGGKVIENFRDTGISEFGKAQEMLRTAGTSVYLRSRSLRHFELAVQCIDDLSMSLSNRDITGGVDSSPALVQFNAKMNELFGEAVALRTQLENDLDDRIRRMEERAKQ